MFAITFDKTKISGKADTEDTAVSEAIFSIYPTYDDGIYMQWNEYSLYLDRRGDMSTIYNDVIDMLQELERGTKTFKSNFLSSTFTVNWNFDVDNQQVKISPQFFDVNIKRGSEHLTMDEIRSLDLTLTTDLNIFIGQWHQLLKSIREDLQRSGYTENLEGFDYLKLL